jgi:hypothetical protein
VHFIITDAWLAKSRAIHLSGTRLVLSFLLLSLGLMVSAAGLYHWVFLKGAREGWPVIGALVRLVVKDEFEQRDRFMRENLDAMARKLGQMQAKLVQLEALGERVSGLAGVNPAEIKAMPGRGGALVSGRSLTLDELQATLADLDRLTEQRTDTSAPPSAGASTPSPAARRCTPAWISRRIPARPSSRLRVASSSPRNCTRSTATWSKSTTATT